MAGLRRVLSLASVFVMHFLSEHEVSGAKYKRTTGQGVSYVNFVREPFRYLNATKVGTSLVADVAFCNIACLSNPSCVSFNVAVQPVDNFGHLLCELLATDKYNASDQFHENPGFDYYGIYTPCSENPCKNGATCIPLYNDDTFKCKCTAGYEGEVCDRDQCVKFDFEHGISDWTKTGKAFDNQPTYGDNPTARGRDQPANLKGDWWIGGAEDRPSPASPAGAMQGDDPQGTLTSPTFRIMGKKLSFLIGGGCNASTVYAELLIDQVPVFKATGSCSETMEERHWDVSAHHGKEAQIRLVDNDSGGWGHINFDHMIDEHCQQSDPIPP